MSIVETGYQRRIITPYRPARLCWTSASQRTAWCALLGAVLLGVTTRPAAAKPCNKDKHTCGVRKECCPGTCFVHACGTYELCCIGNSTICSNTRRAECCENMGEEPCRTCIRPTPSEDGLYQDGIAGGDSCREGDRVSRALVSSDPGTASRWTGIATPSGCKAPRTIEWW